MIIFVDGYDHYTDVTRKWNQTDGDTTVILSPSYARVAGGQGANYDRAYTEKSFLPADEDGTMIVSFAMRMLSATSYGMVWFGIQAPAFASNCSIGFEPTGTIAVLRDGPTSAPADGFLLATAADAFLPTQWNYFEVRCKLASTETPPASSRSVTTTLSSPLITPAGGNTTGLVVGMPVFSANTPVATIISIIPGVNFTISANATVGSTVTMTFGSPATDSDGEVQVRVNGVQVINATGLDNRMQTFKSTHDSFRFGAFKMIPAENQFITPTYFDDLVVLNTHGSYNTTFLGDRQIFTLYPDGAGDQTELTPNTLNPNWQNVNEGTPNDSDYNSSNVLGARDLYTLTNLPPAASTVSGVQVNFYSRRDNPGDRFLVPVVKTSGTHTATALPLANQFQYARALYDRDPAGTAWTAPTVNSMQAGPQVG